MHDWNGYIVKRTTHADKFLIGHSSCNHKSDKLFLWTILLVYYLCKLKIILCVLNNIKFFNYCYHIFYFQV